MALRRPSSRTSFRSRVSYKSVSERLPSIPSPIQELDENQESGKGSNNCVHIPLSHFA
jgi:hypothetical protein